jgi:hypothetical protein
MGYDAGHKQKQIARKLNKEGLKAKRGFKWTPQSVSQFALAMGLRLRAPKWPSRVQKAIPESSQPSIGEAGWRTEIEDVLTSNLSDRSARKCVIAIASGDLP